MDKPCPHHGPIQRPLPPSNRVHCQACGATWDEVGRRVDGEPTVDEMAREMGLTRGVYRNWTTDSDADLVQLETDGQWVWRPSGTLRDHDLRSWPTDADAIRTLYHEHKAKQIDATLAGKRVGPWLTPPAPKVYEASGPPTDPSALAAWLYARVVPGQTIAVFGREGTDGYHKQGIASVTGGDGVLLLRLAADGTDSRPCALVRRDDRSTQRFPTRLLNPDGTVLWEAK